jgi:hypothetical protein
VKSFYAIIFIAVTGSVLAMDLSLIEGTWEPGGRGHWGHDFTIERNSISFFKKGCLNNQIEIIDAFEGDLVFLKEVYPAYNYIIKINYLNTAECEDTKSMVREYVRMSIPKNNLCHSSTFFYEDREKLEKDKSNNWDGNYISGWSGYGDSEKCKRK